MGGSFAGLMALGGYAFAYEPLARLAISRYRLTPPGWTPGLKLRLVALADFHACEPWMSKDRIASICTRANELEGDITLLLGDYAAGMNMVTRYVHSSEWSKALATLKAPLGVHAIMGNHDWWEDRTAQMNGGGDTFGHRALTEAGISVYSNRAVRLEKDGHGFWLAGLEDQLALLPGKKWGRSRMQGLDDLDGTLAQVSDDAPVGNGAAAECRVSMISTERSRRFQTTRPLSCLPTSPIFFRAYPNVCRSLFPAIRMADRSVFSAIRRSCLRVMAIAMPMAIL